MPQSPLGMEFPEGRNHIPSIHKIVFSAGHVGDLSIRTFVRESGDKAQVMPVEDPEIYEHSVASHEVLPQSGTQIQMSDNEFFAHVGGQDGYIVTSRLY